MTKNISVVLVAGSRPEIIKLSELAKVYCKDDQSCIVYTGQHYSYNMRDKFLDELGVKIDYDLGCGTSVPSHLVNEIGRLFNDLKPEYVIVYGDTNSTMAAAIAAKQMNSKLIHIEAGLRSFDLAMIEERNRIYIDSISDFLLSPTHLSKLFLQYEGITDRVFITGNLIVDVCRKYSEKIRNSIASIQGFGKEYLLLTLHRPETVDRPMLLKKLMKQLAAVGYDIVLPIHPRTKNNLAKYNISIPSNVFMLPPQGYLEFLGLLSRSILVLTDSGGVQEESVILKKPCITLRSSTERQETLLIKANKLFPIGYENSSLVNAIDEMVDTKITVNPYGENVTERTVKTIISIVEESKKLVTLQSRVVQAK